MNDQELLNAIRQIVREEIINEVEPITKDVTGMKEAVNEVAPITKDIAGMKRDIAEIKEGLTEVREATNYIADWVDRVEKKVNQAI